MKTLQSQLRNRPILGTDTDASLFVAPTIWPRLQRAIDGGLNALVVGSPGSGKTSLLRMLDREQFKKRTVFVDLARSSTATEALTLIVNAARSRRISEFHEKAAAAERSRTPDGDLLTLIGLLNNAEPSILLLDEPPGGDEGHRLFGRLRDELWQLDHQWVVAISRAAAPSLERPPANAFFEERVELEPLDYDRQISLLATRLPTASEEMLNALAGHVGLPRELIALARRAVLSGEDPEVVAQRIDHANERLAELSALESAIIDHIRHHGGTFGSDRGLSEELGVSAPQLTQILRALAARNYLVTHAYRHGQGRPRTVYELSPELQP